jgi:protoporphyrinogen oxidase
MATPPQRVAVIGTGMAGLVIAYILRNDPRGRFAVEVFEKVKPQSSFP